MGATLSLEQIEDIEKRTHFNRKEIARMHRRFMTMDVEKKGYITVQQFSLLPELCCNPLCELITASFDANKDNKIDFTEFLTSLDVFHPTTDATDKLQVASLLGTFAHAGMDATLHPIAQSVCRRYGDGETLTFEQFTRFITKEDLDSKLTIQF